MSLSRLRVVAAGAAAAIAVLILSGATYESAMRHRAAKTFRMPGRLVDVGGGRRIQIDCRGAGSPTVVLESGLDVYGSLSWAAVHDSIARTTRVCAYSRAGVMWSDRSTAPFSSEGVARDLHAALIAAGEKAPWVLAGHSLGGAYAMKFTALYGPEVSAVVLVDASHPDQFTKFKDAVGKSLQPTPGTAALGDALAWTGLTRLAGANATPPSWPAEVGTEGNAFLPTSLHALSVETESIPATLAAASADRILGDRPLVVLSAGRKSSPDEFRMMGLTSEQGERLAEAKRKLRDDQATWSTHGRHEVVADASHYIQFDRPDAVIRAIREVVAESIVK